MSQVVERFLEALEARDYERLAACFAKDARLRALVPTALREDEGPQAIAARYRLWLGDLESYELLESETAPLLDRQHLRYRIRGINAEDGLCVMEQHGYAAVDGERITALNLVCSGFRPTD